MSKTGKILLGLTVVCLLPWIYFALKLFSIHTGWSVAIADGRKAAEESVQRSEELKTELFQMDSELARLQLDWDRAWTAARSVQPGQITAQGIGTDNGLVPRQIQDENGNNVMVLPPLHAFAPMPEGGYFYVGEFIADPGSVGTNTAVLRPNWFADPQEQAAWNNLPGPWRFLSAVPPSKRTAVDELRDEIVLTAERTQATQQNIAQQQSILTAAEEQRDIRRKELLGDPAAADDPNRPELKVGLLQAVADAEEIRNDIQLAVDQLRRSIIDQSTLRDTVIAEINELSGKLPTARNAYDAADSGSSGTERR